VRIQFAGDIHVEFGGTPIRRSDLVGDVLVLAGDIHGTPSGLVDYLKRLHTTIPIIYVLGNHEYHGGSWEKAVGVYKWRLEKEGLSRQVVLLENESVEISGVRFLGTTLWSDCGNGEQGLSAENIVADFSRIAGAKSDNVVDPTPLSQIKLPPGYVPTRAETLKFLQHMGDDTTKATLSWQTMAARYRESLEWLKQELQKPFAGKTVVATHFAPSIESNAPEYADSPIRKYYCNSLDDWLKSLGDQGPDLWIHGHTHFCVDYMIGKTRIVSNQRGYNAGDVGEFDPKRFVELNETTENS